MTMFRPARYRELVGLFAHCQLFVGNDTGHGMAQAIDLPLLTIVAPGGDKIIANPVNHPPVSGHRYLRRQGADYQLPTQEKDFFDEALFRSITPELVIQRLAALLAQSRTAD